MPPKHFTDSAPEIGVLIYTHERTDDARINMEIIRSLWQESGLFSDIKIVHAFNGQRSWYPAQYQENQLIRLKNPGHFQGAADLIDAGIARLQKSYPKIRYAVVLAADTWCVKPAYIRKIINTMRTTGKVWATCPWGLPPRYHTTGVGMAMDFFVVDLHWSLRYRFFPLKYAEFAKRFGTLIAYLSPWSNVSVEKLARARFADASFRQCNDNVHKKEIAYQQILLLNERVPVHTGLTTKGYWKRRFFWPQIGLITHHESDKKSSLLRKVRGLHGKSISRLIAAKDLSYYNQGKTSRKSFD